MDYDDEKISGRGWQVNIRTYVLDMMDSFFAFFFVFPLLGKQQAELMVIPLSLIRVLQIQTIKIIRILPQKHMCVEGSKECSEVYYLRTGNFQCHCHVIRGSAPDWIEDLGKWSRYYWYWPSHRLEPCICVQLYSYLQVSLRRKTCISPNKCMYVLHYH